MTEAQFDQILIQIRGLRNELQALSTQLTKQSQKHDKHLRSIRVQRANETRSLRQQLNTLRSKITGEETIAKLGQQIAEFLELPQQNEGEKKAITRDWFNKRRNEQRKK